MLVVSSIPELNKNEIVRALKKVRLDVTCLDAKLGILFPWWRVKGTF